MNMQDGWPAAWRHATEASTSQHVCLRSCPPVFLEALPPNLTLLYRPLYCPAGILYSIYPPLFGALVVYSLGGTALSVYIGRPLVGLNFQQEAQEANFRWVWMGVS